jgi:hypothetical protein
MDGGTSYWKTNCFAVAEIVQYVFGLGDIQRGVIYDGLFLFGHGGTIKVI